MADNDVTIRVIIKRVGDSFKGISKEAGAMGKAVGVASGVAAAGVAGIGITAAAAAAAVSVAGAATVLGIAGIGVAAAAQDQRVKTAFGGIKESMKSTITEASQPIVPILEKLGGDLQGFVDGPFGETMTRLITAATPVIDSFAKGLTPALESMLPAIESLFNAGLPFATWMAETFSPNVQGVSGAVKAAADSLMQFGRVMGDTQTDADEAAIAQAGLKEEVVAMKTAADIAKTSSESLGSSLSNGLKTATEGVDEKMNALAATIGENREELSTFAGWVTTAIGAIINLAAEIANFAIGHFIDSMRRNIDFLAGFVRAAQSANESLGRLYDRMRNPPAMNLPSIKLPSIGKFPGFAHGGIVGAAGGGPRSNLTMVGEQGPELVRLPAGSSVRSNPDSRRMMAGGGGGGGTAEIVVRGDGSGVADFLVAILRKTIRDDFGGDTQLALGA